MKTHPLHGLGMALLLLTVAGCGEPGEKAQDTFITIGTGGISGVYYPVGGAIAGMVNSDRQGIRASAEATDGSIYNINAVLSGDLQFGIAQSDMQYRAWHGEGPWQDQPRNGLRSVFSLHPEIVTLVAADDAGIDALADLAGKRVNVGSPGSGNRGNAEDVFRTAGIDPETDLRAESLKAAEAPRMLQDGRIDAFFYTVGHPNGAINEVTAGKRKVHFVPITGMESLLASSPYYTVTQIPAGLYPMASGTDAVRSIGVVTTLVTTEAVPEDVVYAVTRAVLTNLDAFRELHPALATLTPESMQEGLTAPLHAGAERCFRELGLLREAGE